jgi:hypothetical protein
VFAHHKLAGRLIKARSRRWQWSRREEEDFSPKFFRYHLSLLSLHYSFSKRRVTGGKESSPSEPHEEKQKKKDSRFAETRRDGRKGGKNKE